MRSPLVIALILLSAIMLPAQEPTEVDGAGSAEPEEGVVLFEITGVGSVDLIARFAGDTLLLPYRAVCEFLSIEHGVSAGADTLAGELPAGTPFTIVRSSRSASYRGRSAAIGASSVRVINGEPYVERALLADCFGIPLDFDSVSVVVTMQPSLKVPVVARFQNSKRYAALAMGRQSEGAVAADAPIERQLLGSLALDWSLGSNLQTGTGPTAVGFLRAGGPFLYGVLELNGTGSYNRANPRPISTALGSWQWQFSAPDFSLLRRVSVGGTAYGERQRLWAAITNIPASRRHFGVYSLTGEAPPGWTVEMYDRAMLLEVAQVDSSGEYRFDVPLSYSPTTFIVQMIGPRGEQETRVSRLEIHRDQVPPGIIDYSARFSVDALARTAETDGRAELRAGIADWLTLGAGFALRSSSLASISLDSIAPEWHALVWLGASAHAGIRYESRRRILGGELAVTFPGESTVRLTLNGYSPWDRSISATANAGIPFGPFALSLYGRYQKRPGFGRIEATPQISAYAGGISMTAATSFLSIDSDSAYGEISTPSYRGFISSSLRLSALLVSHLYLSGGIIFDHRAGLVSRTDLASSYSLGRSVRLGAGYAVDSMKWNDGTLRAFLSLMLFDRAALLSVGYNVPHMDWKRSGVYGDLRIDFGFGRLRNETIHSEGRIASTASFDGGLLISTAGILTQSEPMVGRGAIVVRSFLDRNANGVWDPDEMSLGPTAAVLRIDDMETASETGRFYNVAPDENYEVIVDKWAFAEHELFPRRTLFPIYVVASTVHIVNVPFAQGFDAVGAGQVLLADGSTGGGGYSQTLNGLRVRLLAVDGSGEFDGEVFGDGSIVFVGVSAGEYRLEVSDAELAERGLRQQNPGTTFMLGTEQRKIPPVFFEMRSSGVTASSDER